MSNQPESSPPVANQRSDSRFDIAIVGELNMDLILYGLPKELPEEQELLATNFTMTLGSSSAILAHNLAVLGTEVGFVSRTGPDQLGAACRQWLSEAGVETSSIVCATSGSATGVTMLLPLPNTTSRRILTYPGAMFEMGIEDIDQGYITSARHFHLSSLFLHKKLLPHIPALFASMKSQGMTTSLDTNDDPDDEWGDLLHQVLPSVDILLCNQREVKKIARLVDPDAAASKIAETVPLVVMKCGSEGAIAINGSTRFHAPGLPVLVADTIGAGDSFNAGFLHQWLQHADLETCLAFGNVTGALSATRSGGTEAFRDAPYMKQFLRANWSIQRD